MSTRKSSFKTGGGGSFNNVDGLVVDYQFTDAFLDTDYTPGKMKDFKTGKLVDKPHSLNCRPRRTSGTGFRPPARIREPVPHGRIGRP